MAKNNDSTPMIPSTRPAPDEIIVRDAVEVKREIIPVEPKSVETDRNGFTVRNY